jgi:hypothetical protein
LSCVCIKKRKENCSYIGLSTMHVNPPALAALVAESKSSRSVPEQMLTFVSIKPLMMTLLPKS